MKVCKQCGQEHEDEMFRSYVPRGKGIYKTTVGRNTICKNCESLNNKANKVGADPAFLEKVAEVYKELQRRGLTPVGAYAAQVLGTPSRAKRVRSDDDLLGAVLGDTGAVDIHVGKLRDRSYSDLEFAYAEHDRLKEKLVKAGRYQEADALLEDWELSEDL